MVCREFFTILIDLGQSEEQIFERIKKDTRFEIRRAATKDNVSCEAPAAEERILGEFCDYYDRFAAAKSQPRVDRRWLSLLASADSLRLSRVCERPGEVLVWHAYHCANRRATLLNSASHYRAEDSNRRSLVSRANRLLHWRDMQHFRNEGFATYDLGGWYEGNTNQQRLAINRFKEEFGGEVVKNFICERALTVKARLFLRVRQLLLGNAI